MAKYNKQISQAQCDLYKLIEKQLNKPGDAWFRKCGVPVECINYENVTLYSSVKLIMNSDVVLQKDKTLFNKFLRTWLSNQGKLSKAYQTKIKNKTTHYGYKIQNKLLRENRLARRAQKKPV